MIRFHCWPVISWSPPGNTERNEAYYFTMPSLISFFNLQVFITLSKYQIKKDAKQGLVYAFWLCLPWRALAPSLLPAALTHLIVVSSSRNATPAISQNILTAKFRFKESQCNDSSCEGLQPDLHCAWNSHVSTWGESRRRVHKDVPILFPLIPEWSQILASLVTPQSLCRPVSPLTWRQDLWNITSVTDGGHRAGENAGNINCYIRARCSKTALLYWHNIKEFVAVIGKSL